MSEWYRLLPEGSQFYVCWQPLSSQQVGSRLPPFPNEEAGEEDGAPQILWGFTHVIVATSHGCLLNMSTSESSWKMESEDKIIMM